MSGAALGLLVSWVKIDGGVQYSTFAVLPTCQSQNESKIRTITSPTPLRIANPLYPKLESDNHTHVARR